MGRNKSDDRRYKLNAEKHVRIKEEPLSPSEINYSLQEPLVSTSKCDSRLDDELLTIQNEMQYGSDSSLLVGLLGLGSPADSSGIIDADKTNDSTILSPYSHFSKPMSAVAVIDTILSWDLEPRPIEEMMRGCC
jgi:hypothetical protein